VGQRETHSDITIARLRLADARQLHRRQQVEAIFRRGGLRLVIEIFDELVRHGAIAETELDRRLEAYARLDPVAALPLHLVGAQQ
jgi:hypothetical protein